MARIREYTQQTSAPGVVDFPTASAGPGAAIGGAIAELGNTGAAIGRALAEREIQKSVWDAELSAAEAENYWASRLVEAKRNAPEGAEGFTEQVTQEFRGWQDNAIATAKTTQAKQLLQNKYTRLFGSVVQDSVKFEAAAFSAQQTRRLSESLTEFQNRVRANPDELYDVESKASELLNGTPWLDNQTKSKMQLEFTQNLYNSGLDGLVSKYEVTPVTVKEVNDLITDLKEGQHGFMKNSSPQEFDAALTRLERRKITLDTEHKANVSLYLQDTLTSIALHGRDPGLLTESGIRAAYKDEPEQADRVIKQINQAKVYYGVKQQVALTTPQQDMEMLSALKDRAFGVAAAPAAAQMADYENAVRAKQQALFSDPFAYVVQNDPSIANDLQESGGDKEKFRSVMERIDATQARLGVPEWRRAVLGKGAAQEATVRFNAMEPERVADELEAMAAQYGSRWGNAMRELSDAKLNPSYMTLARLDEQDDTVVRKDLVAALQAGTDTLKKNIGAEEANAISKSVREELADFAETLKFDGRTGQEVLAAEMASAEALAYLYQQRRVRNPASRAVEALINNRYDFDDTYRVPKGLSGKASDMIDVTVNKLTDDDFVPAKGGDPSLPEEYRKKAARSAALNLGVWLNTESGKGIQLYSPDDSSAMGYSPVVLTNGQPVVISFDEMMSYSPEPVEPEPYSGGFDTGVLTQ